MSLKEPAYPHWNQFDTDDGVQGFDYPGFSKRELACIHLRIPRTGDEELDSLIREARRAEFVLKVNYELPKLSQSDCEELDLPPHPQTSNRHAWGAWYNDVDAILRLRKADALIARLAEREGK